MFVPASRLEGSLSAKRQEQLARAVLDLHEVVIDSVSGQAAHGACRHVHHDVL